MLLKFSDVCALLNDLEKIEKQDVPALRRAHQQITRKVIDAWFKKHHHILNAPSLNGVAVLSTLFPEQRTDRVYGLQEAQLCNLFARCMLLGTNDARRLHEFKEPGKGDLGDCIERIQAVHDDALRGCDPVTVDEIDYALHELAASSRFSSPEVRDKSRGIPSHQVLTPILRRMKSVEMKWAARLILKDFAPVILECEYVLEKYHFLLPGLLRFQRSFECAVGMLKGPLRRYHSSPDQLSRGLFRQEAARLIQPRIGIKLGHPTFHKARSIDHCLKLVNGKRWILERKYDGEYCEVHVDLCNTQQPIRLFSKSGKDSTVDRANLLPTIQACLRIGSNACRIARRCILVGEMVVYCDRTQSILPFHKIRKHVSRSGFFLGTKEDSPPYEYEHLMIIFFDLLLLDDQVTLTKDLVERRRMLRQVVLKLPGRALTSEWKLVDFSQDGSAQVLLHNFSASIAHRHEGLILKPADAPYFSLIHDEAQSRHGGFIKLKKDYMQDLGEERDIVDLLVVGATYNARQAKRGRIENSQATTFHLACVADPHAIRFGKRPLLIAVGSLPADICISPQDQQRLNNLVQFHSRTYKGEPSHADLCTFDLSLPKGTNPTAILDNPVVVEVLGSGFEQSPNSDFHMLRHPRILKIHLDRGWRDATTFQELQDCARASREAPSIGESQETIRILNRLQSKMRNKADGGRLWTALTPISTTTAQSPSTTQSPATTPTAKRGRSPLVQRRDLGNAHSYAGRSRMATSDVDTCASSSNGVASSAICEALQPLPPFRPPNSMAKGLVCQQKSSLSSLPAHARPNKRPASADAAKTGPKKRSQQRGYIGDMDCLWSPTELAVIPTRVPTCTLGSLCRWSAPHAVIHLSPTVENYTILVENPGLISIHEGSLLPTWNLDMGTRAYKHNDDSDFIEESQCDNRRVIIFIEPLRPDECNSMLEWAVSLGGTDIELWDWRVLELRCCTKATASVEDARGTYKTVDARIKRQYLLAVVSSGVDVSSLPRRSSALSQQSSHS